MHQVRDQHGSMKTSLPYAPSPDDNPECQSYQGCATGPFRQITSHQLQYLTL